MSRREELSEFIKMTEETKASNFMDFGGIVGEGRRVLALSDEDMAREFSASVPVVEAWVNKNAAPSEHMRRLIIDRLKRFAIEERNKVAPSPAQVKVTSSNRLSKNKRLGIEVFAGGILSGVLLSGGLVALINLKSVESVIFFALAAAFLWGARINYNKIRN